MVRWFPVVAALLCVVAGPVWAAESDKKPTKKDDSSFGALRAMDTTEAEKQAAAWLKEIKNDDATQTKFKAIWASDRPLIDKVSATFVLGDADAARLLAEARDADTTAPTAIPAILKDGRKSAFYRNNLALAYAKALTLRKVYEEALEAFTVVKVDDVIDPSAFLFHKAVCEYELMLKDRADDTISRLIVDVNDAPARYLQVGALMAYDMQTWQEKDLGWIARKMDNIQRRLDLKRGGKQTQRMQKEVLVRLDEMIKELENKAKGNCPNGGSCPNGKPGNQDGEGKEKSTSPANDTIKSSTNAPGLVDQKKVAEIAEAWGKLPEKERARALVELTRSLPIRDRNIMEAYFRELAKKTGK
jgi:hypothetical protein